MNPLEQFKQERVERIRANSENDSLLRAADVFMRESALPKYSYIFSWMGRPIIQYPQDMIAIFSGTSDEV